MGVRIKDIANKLGVSPGTVSKALNDKQGVGNKLKKKIKKTAKEMGYTPDPIAKRLSTNKSNTLGVFILSRNEIKLKESFGIEILDGITEQANKAGYDILLFTVTADLDENKSYLRLCQERKVEGAIFIGLTNTDPHLEEIKNSQLPTAVIDLKLPGDNIGYISSNNRLGIKEGLDYLWNQGHRQIGFIKAGAAAEVAKIRLAAYKEYLRDKNAYNPDYIWAGDFTEASGYQAGQNIARLDQKPTAIIAANDLMALGAIKGLRENEINVPADISIMGFDNITAGRYSDPSLTTISQDGIALGTEAVTFILNKLNNQPVDKCILLKPELVIRDSVCSLTNSNPNC